MFNQDEKRSEERYTKKLQETITHRQILRNMLDESVEVSNYVMIYRPEFDRISNSNMKENTIYNNQEIKLLANFIKHKTNRQNLFVAINQLEHLSKH